MVEIHEIQVEGPVPNGKPHPLNIVYTAAKGGEIPLSVHPSSFTIVTEKDATKVELPASPTRKSFRVMVKVSGSASMVTIIVGTKPYEKRWTVAFDSSP